MRKMLLAAGLLLLVFPVVAQIWDATRLGSQQWEARQPDGTVISGHQSEGEAIVSCQKWSLENDFSDCITAHTGTRWSMTAWAQTIISVGVCVPTASGIVDTRFCDGDDGQAPTFEWATIPSFTNQIEGVDTVSVDLCATYLTEPNTSTLTNVGASFPTGWSLSGTRNCTLAYSGTGTGSAVVVIRATDDMTAATIDTNSFTVESVAAEDPGTDTTAPTPIVGVTAALNGSDQPVLTFDPSAEARVATQDVSGVSTFTVSRGATPLTETAYTGTGFTPTYADTDIGTVANASATQDVADWTLVGEGGHPNTATDFVSALGAITGDFICTVKLTSLTGGTHTARGGSLFLREGTAAGDRHFAVHLFAASLNVRNYTRAVTDGTVVQNGLVTVTDLPAWFKISRSGTTITGYAGDSDNEFGEVWTETLGLNATLQVGVGATSNTAADAITAVFEDLACTTHPQQTFTDTGATAGTTPSYTIISTDVADNDSVASTAVSIAIPDEEPPPGVSDTPDYPFDITGTVTPTFTDIPVASSGAFDTALGDQDCGERVIVADDTTVNWAKTINVDCPVSNPYVVRCETLDGDSCPTSGLLNITGSGIVVAGFDCNATTCRANVYGQENRLIGNRIRNRTTGVAVHLGTSQLTGHTKAEVAYNDLGAYAGSATNSHFALKDDSSTNVNTVHTHAWFHHNDMHGHKDGNGVDSDFIEPGNSGQRTWLYSLNAGYYIEDNLMRDHLDCGQPVIDHKYSFTVIRRNTLDNGGCGMNIQSRKGRQYIFESNFLVGAGRISVQGHEHTVVCNAGGTIRIQAGESAAGSFDNLHQAASDVLVAGNGSAQNPTTLVLGYAPNGNYDVNPDDIVVEAHQGNITTAQITGAQWTDNRADPFTSYNCVPAVRLTTADVGPGELSSASAAYLSARGLN